MILVNGEARDSISVKDRGFSYGDGLFETLAILRGEIQRWDMHWARFERGCKKLKLALPDEQNLLTEISQVIEHQERQVVKLIYTRGTGERGYRFTQAQPSRIIQSSPWPDYNVENGNGIKLFLCETRVAKQPALAGIKHLNRLENVLARNENSSDEFAEGLMLSTDGEVIEGTMSNVFIVTDGVLKTPELSLCGVQGVMRDYILKIAQREEMPVSITTLTMNDIVSAEEMFMSNSLIGIWPVNAFGSKVFPDVRPITKRLQQSILVNE